MLPAVESYFASSRCLPFREMPFGWRRIDVVFVDTQSHWIGVELKISNWRSALLQAITNRQLVNKSYVALWHRHLIKVLEHEELFKRHQIGLLEVTEDGVREIVGCKHAPTTLLMQRGRAISLNKVGRKGDTEVPHYGTVSFLPA